MHINLSGKIYPVFYYCYCTDEYFYRYASGVCVYKDVLLISVFGGLINGFAISLCLNVGTTTGGTDFISIFLSQQKGIDAWNYILAGNVLMLVVAGALFGWSIALYSIIYQFCSTQIIQALYKRYQKETMFIISDKSNEIYRAIRERTNHDATLFQGIGCYEEKQKTLIYSVINSEAKGSCFRLSVRLIPMLLSMLCGQKNLRGVFMIFHMIKSFMQIQSHK